MAHYKDSLGNVYTSLPKAPPIHKAKPTSEKTEKNRARKNRDSQGNTRPTSKYWKYRMRVGKPLGRGVPGNKAGRHKVKAS